MLRAFLFDLLAGASLLLHQGWCQGALACDRQGQEVTTTAPEASGWSLLGALYRSSVELLPYHGTTIKTRFRLLDLATNLLCSQLPPHDTHPYCRLAMERWAAAPGRLSTELFELIDLAMREHQTETSAG